MRATRQQATQFRNLAASKAAADVLDFTRTVE
jgi:hypothetical protein